MKFTAILTSALLATATAALAQGAPTQLVVPPGGATDFCYFDGLAYSKNSVLLVDVTNRRESPQATQKALLECSGEDGSDNLVWVRVDNE